MRFVTSDPRSGGFADGIGGVLGLVSGGTITTLVKAGAGNTAWTSVPPLLPSTPMNTTKCPVVTSDPSSGGGRTAQVNDIVLYDASGVGAYYIKYGAADTDWVQLPDTTGPGGGGLVADGDKGDITVTGSGVIWTIDNNVVSNAKLRDSSALSVIGRSTNTSGDPADIAASSDGDVLRRSGTTLGFGSIPESSVTGLVADLAARPTGSGTVNTVPKWTSSTVLGNSAITDDGTDLSYTGVAARIATGAGTGASEGRIYLGQDATAATNAQAGLNFIVYTDGNNYIDSKTFAAGTTRFRCGAGAEAGYARTWLQVANATGNVTLGVASTSAHSVNGRVSLLNTDSTQHAIIITNTPSAGTTTETSGIRVVYAGTIDTTAGSTVVNGYNVDISTTRSAGASSLIVQGVRSFASGGQDVRAGRFGASGGTVQTTGLFATASGSATDSYAALAQTTSTGTNNYGINASATGAGTTNYGARFSAANAGVNTALRTDSGNVTLNVVAGVTTVGFNSSTAGALAVSGAATFNSSSSTNAGFLLTHSGNNNSAFSAAYTPSASTTSNLFAFAGTSQGTYDTTLGALNAFAAGFTASGTRSAGGNALNNLALLVQASGGQTNTALRAVTGDVQLNTTSGNTIIGSTGTPVAKLQVLGGVIKLQSPGSFTIPTDYASVMAKRLTLTGTQRVTIAGTGRLSMRN